MDATVFLSCENLAILNSDVIVKRHPNFLNASVLKLLMIQSPGYFLCIFVTFLERKFLSACPSLSSECKNRMQVFVLGIS